MHAGRSWGANGLSAVVTDPARRGQGHGLALVAAAREHMAASGVDLGLFTCDRPLLGFYERAGWIHLPGSVVIGGTPDDPFPSDRWDKVTFASFFSLTAWIPRDGVSVLDLFAGGDPFEAVEEAGIAAFDGLILSAGPGLCALNITAPAGHRRAASDVAR